MTPQPLLFPPETKQARGKRPRWIAADPPDLAVLSKVIKHRPAAPRKPARYRFADLAGGDLLPGETLAVELRDIILNIAQTATTTGECNPKYHKTSCGCGFKVHRVGCRKKDCPGCADGVAKRRARAIRRKLEPVVFPGSNPRALGYLVVTIPPRLRPGFRDPKTWRAFARGVFRILKTKYKAAFALEVSHIFGDKPDGMEQADWERLRVFHPHLNFLWIAEPGRVPWLDRDAFTKDLQGLLQTYGAISWHNRYYKKKKQVRHKIKYVVKPAPGFAKWLGPVRWFGSYPRGPVEDPYKGKCGCCGQKLEFFGFSNVFEYEEHKRQGTVEAANPPPVPWDDLIRQANERYAKR